MATKDNKLTQRPNLDNVFYVDCNRINSINSDNSNASWTYQMNQGIHLPQGTQVGIQQVFLNSQGILGGSIEFPEDTEETINFGYYVPQGSYPILAPIPYSSLNAGTGDTPNFDATNGSKLVWKDTLEHRNIMEIKATPYLVCENVFPPENPFADNNIFGNNSLLEPVDAGDVSIQPTLLKFTIAETNISDFNQFSKKTNADPTGTGFQLLPTASDNNIPPVEQFLIYNNEALPAGFTPTPDTTIQYTVTDAQVPEPANYFMHDNSYNTPVAPSLGDFGADRVVRINFFGGSGYSLRDRIVISGGGSTRSAWGIITEVDGSGAIVKANLVYCGQGFTSAPTITITQSDGTTPSPGSQATEEVYFGRVVSTRTNGSGQGMQVGIYTENNGVFFGCVAVSGLGYRYDDLIYIDAVNNFSESYIHNDSGTYALYGALEPKAHTFPKLTENKATVEDATLRMILRFSNAPDIPQPFHLESQQTGELLYYNSCSGIYLDPSTVTVGSIALEGGKDISQGLYFSMNTNKQRSNASISDPITAMYKPFQTGKTSTTNYESSFFELPDNIIDPVTDPSLVVTELEYDIEMRPTKIDTMNDLIAGTPLPAAVTRGKRYREIPDILYKPSGYDEEELNAGGESQGFYAIMDLDANPATDCYVDSVVYIPRANDVLSHINCYANQQSYKSQAANFSRSLRTNGTIDPGKAGDTEMSALPPGVLRVSGGAPAVDPSLASDTSVGNLRFLAVERAQCRFSAANGFFPAACGKPKTMPRNSLNKRPISTRNPRLSLVIVEKGDIFYQNNQVCNLVADSRYNSGTGSGGQVTIISCGYGQTEGRPVVIEVTNPGDGYVKGEEYMLVPDGQVPEEGKTPTVVYIRETAILAGLPSNLTTKLNQLWRPARVDSNNAVHYNVPNGICDQLSNSAVGQALFKGNTINLQGDAYGNGNIELYSETLPRNGFNFTSMLGGDDLNAVGGTNEPLGLVEIDAGGVLTPVVGSASITIEKGVYGIQELGDKVNDQLNAASTRQGFLEGIPLAKKIDFIDVEPAQLNGYQMNKKGYNIFVPMSVYNALMENLSGKTPITNFNSYKWNEYKHSGYYSFLKAPIGLNKKANSLIPGNKQIDQFNLAIGDPIDNQPAQSIQYDTTKNGTLIGTADFSLSFNQTASTFQIDYLHTPTRTPAYDKFGNQFEQSDTIGCYIKKVADTNITTGIRNEYSESGALGGEYKTPQNIISALENPYERVSGIMIYNFSSSQSGSTGNQYSRFRDTFGTLLEAQNAWANSLWAKLGFSYNQLNGEEASELINYYNYGQPTERLYGITTKMKLDSTALTSISSLNYITPSDSKPPYVPGAAPVKGQGSDNSLVPASISNTTFPNTPHVPVFLTTATPVFDASVNSITQQFLNIYNGCFYDACLTYFVETSCDSIVGSELPTLSRNGYFIITSDVVPTWRDSIKKGEPLPTLGFVAKSNWESQDFINRTSDIVHVINQPKTINSIQIRILNPDLTEPLLRPDSSVILKFTLPPISGIGFTTAPEEDPKEKS